jgi:hypothetical protein
MVLLLAGGASLSLPLGCCGDGHPAGDMNASPDLFSPPPRQDMAERSDMGASPSDMKSMGEHDMGMGTETDMGGPTLVGLPTCSGTGVTADSLYASIVEGSCAGAKCHGGGAGGLTMTSAATFKANTVGVASTETMLMPRVSANNLNQSYLLYKLLGQQKNAGGKGGRMPEGGPELSDDDLCQFITWISEGAN